MAPPRRGGADASRPTVDCSLRERISSPQAELMTMSTCRESILKVCALGRGAHDRLWNQGVVGTAALAVDAASHQPLGGCRGRVSSDSQVRAVAEAERERGMKPRARSRQEQKLTARIGK